MKNRQDAGEETNRIGEIMDKMFGEKPGNGKKKQTKRSEITKRLQKVEKLCKKGIDKGEKT